MKTIALVFVGLLLSSAHAPWALASAKVLHQTKDAVAVRMTASEETVVWQLVGNDAAKTRLETLNLSTGAKSYIEVSRRPFGPSADGGFVAFGAGDAGKGVDVFLAGPGLKKPLRIDDDLLWIVEPAVQLSGSTLRVLWDRADNLDGDRMSIRMLEADVKQPTRPVFSTLVEGPVFRKEELPPEYHSTVHNEYPEISGDSVAFQNNEYGMPNIYRLELSGKTVKRLKPSMSYQERPAISGRFTVWEESEKGFATSWESDIYAHDLVQGEVIKLNPETGFHYQARAWGERYAIYGAKRPEAPNTPSLRVYDLKERRELRAQDCFPGTVFDWSANSRGVYALQKVNFSTSRLLFASWEQIHSNCVQ